MTNRAANRARAALISLSTTIFVTAVHHIFRLGPELIIPSLIGLSIPALLVVWYRKVPGRTALVVFGMFTALVVFWFGFIDGFMDHVLKAAGLANTTFLPGSDESVIKTVFSLWSPGATSVFYEGTGVLSFGLSTAAAFYAYKFIRSEWLRLGSAASFTA